MLRTLVSPSSNRACSARRRYVPWRDVARHADGASFGFAKPQRRFGKRLGCAAE